VEKLLTLQKIICFALLLLIAADLLTTLLGVLAGNASEANPLLQEMTNTNTLLFVVLKTATIIVTGVMMAGATKLTTISNAKGKTFFSAITVTTCAIMTVVVGNNMIILLSPT
jgi:hypothetical protein